MLRMLYYFFKNLNYSSSRILLTQLRNKFRALSPFFLRDLRYYMLMEEKQRSSAWLLDGMYAKNELQAHYFTRTSLLKESLSVALQKFDSSNMFLEFGVCTGFTINYMSTLYPNLTFNGFDCFDGLPEDWRPEYKKGSFKIRIPSVNPNVNLVIGLFDDTLPRFISNETPNIAFLHIDSDLYSSCKTILRYCLPRITSGTVIVFDEFFGYIGWRNGEFKAFEEFVKEFDVTYKFIGFGSEQLAIRIESINTSKIE